MQKFTSINQFRHVVKLISRNKYLIYPKLTWTGSCKLHGTNSSINRVNNNIICQSRNNIITIDSDNYGFANFINRISSSDINKLFDIVSNNVEDDIVIYGEWIGPGIQSKCGINLLPENQFVIFGIKINNQYIKNIKNLCLQNANIYNILDIPTYHVSIGIDNVTEASKVIEDMVQGVDSQCPWAKHFGYDGPGEGIVFICDQFPTDEKLWFKSKGNSHVGKSKKVSVEIDSKLLESIESFVEYSITENRLNQGIEYLQEQKLDIDMKSLGEFLRWLYIDINKEEYDVLESSKLTWKEISKSVNNRARKWFIIYINNNF